MNDLGTIYATESLGKQMPPKLGRTVTAAEHFRAFYALSSCDVWTPDGWLVTAVENDGVVHHLRKGSERMRRAIDPSTMLFYNPNPQSIRHGF